MQPVKDVLSLQVFKGEETEVTLPSGRILTIREINGEDESVLSKVSSAKDGTNIPNYLARIITSEKFTPEQIMDWPRNDVYYLLFSQRIFNYGPELLFTEDGVEYEQDLREFDYDKGIEGVKLDSTHAKFYPGSNPIEFKTDSGKELKFNILTYRKESLSLKRDIENENNNDFLIDRDLSIKDVNEWIPLKTFHYFSGKEMRKIRSYVNYFDVPFNPVVKFNTPTGPKGISLFLIPNFYYPEEKIKIPM